MKSPEPCGKSLGQSADERQQQLQKDGESTPTLNYVLLRKTAINERTNIV